MQTCEIWPEHQQAFELFQACSGQWQPLVSGMGGILWRGAQLVNVAQAMRFMRVPAKQQPALWQQYRVMEAEALTILQRRSDKAAQSK